MKEKVKLAIESHDIKQLFLDFKQPSGRKMIDLSDLDTILMAEAEVYQLQ